MSLSSLRAAGARALERIRLLQGLSAEEQETIARSLTWREVRKNEVVIAKGTPGEHLLFLFEGQLKVVDVTAGGREIGLNLLRAGDHFGELAIIDGGSRSATVIAMEPATVALLPREQAWALFYRHPLIAQRVLTDLASRLRRASSYQTLLCLPHAHQRLFALLQLLSRSYAAGVVVIDNLPRQHELAIMANTSRETVSRALGVLLDEGIVERDGRRLIVRAPEKLLHFALSDEA